MPARFARRLTDRTRSAESDQALGTLLAFVAGGINAGGFFAVRQYTSHMTGLVAAAASNLVLGRVALACDGLAAVAAFLAGAMATAILVNFGRRRGLASQFALPILLEGVLLLVLGVAGDYASVPVAAALLCFVMGLQNALITKATGARIRTTHITGTVTDIGIELGKAAYWNSMSLAAPVIADRQRLRSLALLAAAFVLGSLAGAAAFLRFGFAMALVPAALLTLLAAVPALDDLAHMRR